MSVYKVPQDVEAEDKFLGPLSFKQFLLGGTAGALGYLMFVFATRQVWLLVALILPVFLVLAILAVPWSKDQPSELWLASRIRFFIVPRKRIWDQSGVKDLVQITVPKREVHLYTDGLSQDQVRSRLSALATVVDTRGWAVKNLSTVSNDTSSDRLVVSSVNNISDSDAIINSTIDVMDEQSSQVAKQLSSMINESEDKHRKDTLAMIQAARQETHAPATPPQTLSLPTVPTAAPSSTLQAVQQARSKSSYQPMAPVPTAPNNDAYLTAFRENVTVAPGESPSSHATSSIAYGSSDSSQIEDEGKVLEKIKQKKKQDADILKNSHQKVIHPLSEQVESAESENQMPEQAPFSAVPISPTYAPQTPSAPPVDPAILALADNDDLNVATLARQAKRDLPDDGEEVIISLH